MAQWHLTPHTQHCATNSFTQEVGLAVRPLLWPNVPPTLAEVLQFHLRSLDGATAPLTGEDLGKESPKGGSHRVSASCKAHLHLPDPSNLGCTTQVTWQHGWKVTSSSLNLGWGPRVSLGITQQLNTLLSPQEALEDRWQSSLQLSWLPVHP